MASLESLRFAQEEHGGVAGAFALADLAAREAPGRATWDCAAGCSFCCHLPVMATPSEAAAIGPQVSGAAWERVVSFESGRCALLADDGTCSVYDVRPLKCRAHTSTSRDACEAGGDIQMDGWMVRAIEALRTGMDEPAEPLAQALLRWKRATA